MTELMDAGQVEVKLNEAFEEIEAYTDAASEADEALTQAEATYKFEYAKALLTSEQSSDPKRKAEADIATYELSLAVGVAKDGVAEARRHISRIATQIDILRSLNALQRKVI